MQLLEGGEDSVCDVGELRPVTVEVVDLVNWGVVESECDRFDQLLLGGEFTAEVFDEDADGFPGFEDFVLVLLGPPREVRDRSVRGRWHRRWR